MENCNPTDSRDDYPRYNSQYHELCEVKKENRELREQVRALLSLLNGPDK